MAIGRSFEESLMKTIRSLETGLQHLGLKTKPALKQTKISNAELECVMTKDYSSSAKL